MCLFYQVRTQAMLPLRVITLQTAREAAMLPVLITRSIVATP